MASFCTDGNDLGIAFRTRSNTAFLLEHKKLPGDGASGGALGLRGPMTIGPDAATALELLPTTQLPQLPPASTQLTAAPAQSTKADALSVATSMPLIPSALTLSQRGELELARSRAERAAAGRSRPSAATAAATAPGACVTGGGGGGVKRRRGGAASMPNSSDDEGGDHSDGELELSRLSPEEQECVLRARLAAGGGAGASDMDARRLKRLLRNRVSAQQARERKKQYVTSLEAQIREQQSHIGLLEKRLEDVESQNEALRNIIMTMRGLADNAPAGGGSAGDGPARGNLGGRPHAAAAPPHPGSSQQQHVRFPPGPAPRLAGGVRRLAVEPPPPPLLLPQQPDQVVPELPPGHQHFSLPHEQHLNVMDAVQQEEEEEMQQQPQQQHLFEARHLRIQMAAGPCGGCGGSTSELATAAATAAPVLETAAAAGAAVLPYQGGLAHAVPATAAAPPPLAAPYFEQRGGDGNGSSNSGGFAAVSGAGPTAAAAVCADSQTHGSICADDLRCRTPVLGRLPEALLEAGNTAALPYGEGFGDDQCVTPAMEVPDCGIDIDADM